MPPTDSISEPRPADSAAPSEGSRASRARLAFAGSVGAMVVLTSLASATNYASNLVFSRVLNPVGFGELTSLLALAVILALPTGAAQTVIAERVAHYRALGRKDIVEYLLRHALAHVAVIAAAVSVLYVAAIPLVVDVLDLQHPGPAIALAPLVTLMFLQPVALGGVQGLDRFVAYGIMVLAIAVSRIAFGLPWAWAGGGAGGAIGGQAIGQLVVLVGALWVMRRHFRRRGSGAARAGLRRRLDARALTASAAFIAFAVISNLDVVLARLFLSPHDAGIYAAVATVGKVVTFLPAAIAIAMVPSAARARHSEGDSSRILRLSALVVTGTALAAAIPAALAPGLVVDVMFGSDYRTAEAGVLPIVAAGAGFAMVNLLVVYAVAIRDQKWAWLLVLGVAAQVVGITLFHDTPAQVACVQAVVAAMILAVNEYWFHSIVRRRPQAA